MSFDPNNPPTFKFFNDTNTASDRARAEAARVASEAVQGILQNAVDDAEQAVIDAQQAIVDANTAADLITNPTTGALKQFDDKIIEVDAAILAAEDATDTANVAAGQLTPTTELSKDLLWSLGEIVLSGNTVTGLGLGFNIGTFVLPTAVTESSYLKTVTLWAGAAGTVLLKRFSGASAPFALEETLATLTIPGAGSHTFTSDDFGILKLNDGDRIGFSTTTNNLIRYVGSTSSFFYNADANATTVTTARTETLQFLVELNEVNTLGPIVLQNQLDISSLDDITDELCLTVGTDTTVGNENPVTGSSWSAGTTVFGTPMGGFSVLQSLSLYAGAAGSLSLKRATISAGTVTIVETLATITIPGSGNHTFTRDDFGLISLNQGEYIAVSTATANLIVFNGTLAGQGYYNASATLTSFATGSLRSEKWQALFTFSELPASLSGEISDMVTELNQLLGAVGVTDIYGNTPVALGSGFTQGTIVLARAVEGTRILNSLTLHAGAAGSVKLKRFTKSGDNFTLVETLYTFVIPGAGAHTFDVSDFGRIVFEQNDYIGLSTPTSNLLRYSGTVTGQYYYVNNAEAASFTDTTTGPERPQVTIETFAYPLEDRWGGQTVITWGDSITWYDGQPFASSHIEFGQTAVGYQTWLRRILGVVIDNQGRSGHDITELWDDVQLIDHAGAYAVTLTSGANDHRMGIPLGTVLPIGDTFNVATFAGAFQACVEKILTDNPTCKLILITPIRGWYNESGTVNVPGPYNDEELLSVDYVNVIKEIGALYSLPVCDWYNASGLNDLNKDIYLGDNPAVFTSYLLHPRQVFFQRMGEMLAEFLSNY